MAVRAVGAHRRSAEKGFRLMNGFRLYDAGYAEPVRLSVEHAEALGATEVSEPDENRPARNASKADWVAYAVDQGMTLEGAEAQTRAQLIDQLG